MGGTTVVNHPVVGELNLHRDTLPVDDLTLVVYYPDIGSDSAGKLGALASLAAITAPDDQPPAHEGRGARPGRRGGSYSIACSWSRARFAQHAQARSLAIGLRSISPARSISPSVR